ncbi:MAG: hypothetical protein NUV77_10415 [Thermoguttaceae bacterium]|jgi:hypothetical protein|nr:hypothetical protein [Thermoguttaceae bacterium]
MKRLLGILLVVCGPGLAAIYGFCAVCALANVRQGRGGPAYYVVCTSWNRPGETIEFPVSPAEYERVVVGRSEMHITTSAGRLGIEWMRDRRLVIDPLPHGLRHELGQIAVLAGLWRDTLAA